MSSIKCAPLRLPSLMGGVCVQSKAWQKRGALTTKMLTDNRWTFIFLVLFLFHGKKKESKSPSLPQHSIACSSRKKGRAQHRNGQFSSFLCFRRLKRGKENACAQFKKFILPASKKQKQASGCHSKLNRQ